MKKRILSVCIILMLTAMLTGCCLQHQWVGATCTEPMTCAVCGKTEGSPIDHTWEEPTCTRPRTCASCGAIEGDALGHVWKRSSCTEPKTCSVCGAIDGDPMEHTWIAATCVAPMHCSVCGLTEGTTIGHQWMAANFNSPRMCAVCGMTEGSALTPYTGGLNGSDFNYSLALNTKQNYSTITGYDNRIANGTVTVVSYNKYASDATHPAKEGYEWREIKVVFSMDKPSRVMWGYTDSYAGLSEYAKTDYITFADGTREKVNATQSFSSEIANIPSEATAAPTPTAEPTPEPTQAPSSDSSASPAPPTAPQITPSPTPTPVPTPESEPDKYISYVSQAVQVPIKYDGLIFYVCNADYENDHRVDDSFQFMKMY